MEVGSLDVVGTDLTCGERKSIYGKEYSATKITKSGNTKMTENFGWPRLNGKKVLLKKAQAYYPDKGGPDSPDCAWVKAVGENCVVEVGPIFKRDEAKRRPELLR